MACISLGKIDKNLIPIVIGCIVCFFNRLLNQYDETLLFKNIIIPSIYISLSRFLAVIPYIILKIRTKGFNDCCVKNINKDPIKYIYNNNQNVITKGKKRYTFLSAIIYLINQFQFVPTFKIKTNSWIWIILITSIFYYFIFKIKLYKHHYISAILIILIGVIIDLFLKNLQNDIINDLPLLLIKFVREILFSLYNVLAKYVMEKKFVSVYEFSFYIGLINLIIVGIFSVFDYYYFRIDNYEEYFSNFNVKESLVMLGVIISQFGINISSLFTVKNNTPCHTFIIFVFGQFAYYVNFEIKSIIVIICFIFILFLSLIFNEIIEINFWKLSYNTRRNISERASTEDFDIKKINITDFDSMNESNENLSGLKDSSINSSI